MEGRHKIPLKSDNDKNEHERFHCQLYLSTSFRKKELGKLLSQIFSGSKCSNITDNNFRSLFRKPS